jgi:hypothetical protein
MLRIELTNEITAEILATHGELLEEISIHDGNHKAILIKKPVLCFMTIKGKHLCRSLNIEQNTLSRHQNTRAVLFKHE